MTSGSRWDTVQIPRMTLFASHLLNSAELQARCKGPILSISTQLFCLVWKLHWVYLCGIFQPGRRLLGHFSEPPWSFHELSWETSDISFGTVKLAPAQHWPHSGHWLLLVWAAQRASRPSWQLVKAHAILALFIMLNVMPAFPPC